jgi:hypothetical protein
VSALRLGEKIFGCEVLSEDLHLFVDPAVLLDGVIPKVVVAIDAHHD